MPHAAPQGLFETRSESERVAVSVSTDEEWRGLCRVLEADDWRLSERLSTHRGRLENHTALVERLSAWIATRSRDEVLQALLAAGVPASASINSHALMPNPQLTARRFFQTMKHPVTGETRYPAFPAIFSRLERDLHRAPPPTLGQHNREVLHGELGVDDREFERLEAEGVIGTRPSFL